jgi:hypothetical protein
MTKATPTCVSEITTAPSQTAHDGDYEVDHDADYDADYVDAFLLTILR